MCVCFFVCVLVFCAQFQNCVSVLLFCFYFFVGLLVCVLIMHFGIVLSCFSVSLCTFCIVWFLCSYFLFKMHLKHFVLCSSIAVLCAVSCVDIVCVYFWFVLIFPFHILFVR